MTVDRRGAGTRRRRSCRRSSGSPTSPTRARSRSCWPTTTRPTGRPSCAEEAAQRLGLRLPAGLRADARQVTALNTALAERHHPAGGDRRRRHLPAPRGAHATWSRASRAVPRASTSAPAPGRSWSRTPTANFLTRMQGWDYRLGINGVKRMQAAYNSALVAQGAFSAYWTDDLRAVGGWPDAIGEDIVLTWTLMHSRGIVQYEPTALGFTHGARAGPPLHAPALALGARHVRGAPEPTRRAASRACWRSSSPGSTTSCRSSTSATSSSGCPGSILFIFGYPLLFSWWSMLVIPITLLIYGLLRRWQERHVFRRLGVLPRAGQARVLRLPVRLPGADLGGLAARLLAVPRPGPPAAGSNRRSNASRNADPRRWRSM